MPRPAHGDGPFSRMQQLAVQGGQPVFPERPLQADGDEADVCVIDVAGIVKKGRPGAATSSLVKPP